MPNNGNLPQRLPIEQMQVRWAAVLQPILSNPATNPTLLQNISLASGANTVNHLLGRKLTSWKIARMRANFAQIYDTQDENKMPELTLLLTSSAAVVVDIEVY